VPLRGLNGNCTLDSGGFGGFERCLWLLQIEAARGEMRLALLTTVSAADASYPTRSRDDQLISPCQPTS
jgi:hypothetical protein